MGETVDPMEPAVQDVEKPRVGRRANRAVDQYECRCTRSAEDGRRARS